MKKTTLSLLFLTMSLPVFSQNTAPANNPPPVVPKSKDDISNPFEGRLRKMQAPDKKALDNVQSDSVIASVNGIPISLLDIVLESGHGEVRLTAIYSGSQLYDEVKKYRRKIVDEIIERKLIYETYKNKPFDIPRQYVEDMLDSLAIAFGDGSRASLDYNAKKHGTTVSELREKALEKVAVDIIVHERCDRPVSMTPKEVYDYYQANKETFSIPAQIELQLLLIRHDGKYKDRLDFVMEDIKNTVSNGGLTSFTDMVTKYSEGPSPESGGKTGMIEEDKLRAEFIGAVKGKAAGTVSEFIKTDEGYYMLRVISRKDAEFVPFEKASIYIQNKVEIKEKERRFKEFVDKLKADAIIRYYF